MLLKRRKWWQPSFPIMFSTLSESNKSLILSSADAYNLDWTKSLPPALYYTIPSFYDLDEEVCRKYRGGKKEKILVTSIFPFPTVFSTLLKEEIIISSTFSYIISRSFQFWQVWNWAKGSLTPYQTLYNTIQSWLLTTLYKKPFENMVEIGENAGNQHFLLFPPFYYPFQIKFQSFSLSYFVSVLVILLSANALNFDRFKILLCGKG